MEEMMVPDVLHLSLMGKDCYIFKENNKFKAQAGLAKSGLMDTPGKCLDWVIQTCNKGPISVEITDISEIMTETKTS